MSRHQVAGGLTVRGTCPAGHVTEATTDKGRTTWEGTCANDGCDLHVKARTRVGAAPAPATDTPAEDPSANDQPEPPATAPPKPKPKVKQVDYDAQPRKRDQPRRRPAGGSTATPAKEPAAASSPVHRGAEPAAADPGEPPATGARRARIRERITGRREAGPAPKAAREFRLPY